MVHPELTKVEGCPWGVATVHFDSQAATCQSSSKHNRDFLRHLRGTGLDCEHHPHTRSISFPLVHHGQCAVLRVHSMVCQLHRSREKKKWLRWVIKTAEWTVGCRRSTQAISSDCCNVLKNIRLCNKAAETLACAKTYLLCNDLGLQ